MHDGGNRRSHARSVGSDSHLVGAFCWVPLESAFLRAPGESALCSVPEVNAPSSPPSRLHKLVVGPEPARRAQLHVARGTVQREGCELGLALLGLRDAGEAELEGRRLVLGGEVHLAALHVIQQGSYNRVNRVIVHALHATQPAAARQSVSAAE